MRSYRRILANNRILYGVAAFIVCLATIRYLTRRPAVTEVQNCPLCSITPLNPPTSTRRDVILAAAFDKLKRVEFFLRTLRSTGTKARVILFINNPEYTSPRWLRFFRACDIEPVFTNESNAVITKAPKLSRYYFYEQWLEEHRGEVDRVLHTDTFDVIFQSDPFIPAIKKDMMYFTEEPVTLQNSGWTKSWMKQCYGSDLISPYNDQKVSCSGVTLGGIRPFLTYLDTLLSTPEWSNCFGHSLDQAHHNYLLFNGGFASRGISISMLNCSSPYLTMHFCCKVEKCTLEPNGNIRGPTQFPVLVHQYNRWKNATKLNSVKCNNTNDGAYLNLDEQLPLATVEYMPPLTRPPPSKYTGM